MTKEELKQELYHYIATQCTAISINMEHRLVYHYDQMEKVGEFIYNLEEKRIAELEQQLDFVRDERNKFQEKCEDIELNYYCDRKGGCKVQELEEENNKFLDVISNYEVKVADLESIVNEQRHNIAIMSKALVEGDKL